MTLPLFLTATGVSFFSRSVIHIACMTISTRRATKKKKVRSGLISGGLTSQTGKTIRVLHDSEPDGLFHTKYLETASQYSI